MAMITLSKQGENLALPTVEKPVDDTRKLVPHPKVRAAHIERDRSVPRDILETIGDIGLSRRLQPRRFGALELGFSQFVRIQRELGRG